MNSLSDGRIKVDSDEWGTKVLVPREDDPQQHDAYYVNHPGFSLNDLKRFAADMVAYLPAARMAGIPKGFSGRVLTAAGTGLLTEAVRDTASIAAGGEWNPLNVFGGTVGIAFGQAASEGIGKILQAGVGLAASPKRVSPDVAKSVDLRTKVLASTEFGRKRPVYRTLPVERRKDTGRLYELTPKMKSRLKDAGIDPNEFNDEAILALNRIVHNNSQAVNILSGRTALGDIPMTNVQKAVQDDVISYNQYTQQNPVRGVANAATWKKRRVGE